MTLQEKIERTHREQKAKREAKRKELEAAGFTRPQAQLVEQMFECLKRGDK
jgi:hypothetical protein